MSAPTDALTDVATVLTAAGITSIIKEFSNATPPTVEHAVMSVESSSLDRQDVDVFDGTMTVTIDWHRPGAKADGQTEFLAAMDAFDAIVVALVAGLDRTCQMVDPSGNIEREEESADLAHWYAGTIVCTFMRREPASTP
jgi:hypothetical protein